MNSKIGKRSNDRPTLDEFHQLVTTLSPDQPFTKAAIEAFRAAYFFYLDEVAFSLVQHDKVSEKDEIVLKACQRNGEDKLFLGWANQAQDILLKKKSHGGPATGSKSKGKRRKKMTAEMEAEQERLLKVSMDAMKDRQDSSKR